MIEFLIFGLFAFVSLLGAFAVLTSTKLGEVKGLKVLFVIGDWLFNWVYMPIWFPLDFPKTPFELVTGRLKRYKKLPPHTREYKFAMKLGARLNKTDPGHF